MKTSIYVLVISLLTFGVVQAAAAEMTSGIVEVRAAPASKAEQKCVLQGTGTVSVNFSNFEKDILNFNSTMDKKIRAIEALAKEAGLKDTVIQSMNYNANSNSSGGCGDDSSNKSFQTSANISFIITPTDGGAVFVDLLTKKGYNASLNVNTYRQCGGNVEGDLYEGGGH